MLPVFGLWRRPLPAVRLASASGVALAVAFAATACGPDESSLPPTNRPAFPTGLAVRPGGDQLLVVSSSFDFRYEDGSVLVADLDRVRRGLAPSAEQAPVIDDAYVGSALFPLFGDRPVFTSDGARAFVASKNLNQVIEVPFDGADISCPADEIFPDRPRCGGPGAALQLNVSDPQDVLLLDETVADDVVVGATGLVSSLASGVITTFTYSETANDRLTRAQLVDLGVDIAGVRSLVLRPENSASPRQLLIFAERGLVSTPGAELILMEPRQNATLNRFDLALLTGSLSVRDAVLLPGVGGEPDAVIVILRTPDAIARLEIVDAPTPQARLAGISEICRDPINLAVAPGPLPRVLVTCHEGQSVVAIDPLTLTQTDAVRFFGRNPYDVVVDDTAAVPRAYVSFFLDDSIGVLDLADSDGAAALIASGRVGAQSPAPEDGRQ